MGLIIAITVFLIFAAALTRLGKAAVRSGTSEDQYSEWNEDSTLNIKRGIRPSQWAVAAMTWWNGEDGTNFMEIGAGLNRGKEAQFLSTYLPLEYLIMGQI